MIYRDPNFRAELIAMAFDALEHLRDLLSGKVLSNKYGSPEWFAAVRREWVAASECHRVLVWLERA